MEKQTGTGNRGGNNEARGIKMKRKPMFDDLGTTLLNGIKVGFERGFGYCQNPALKNSAHCIDDNRVIYVLASQIVLYDMLAETQKVIDSFDIEESVGALIYFKNIMLEDNVVYSLENASKSFPSLILHNFTKNYTQNISLANLEKEQSVSELTLINECRNVIIVSHIDSIVRLTMIEIITKEIKMSEYISFIPLGIHTPSQFPNKVILHNPTEIYVVDTEDCIKLLPLNFRKAVEALPNTEFCKQEEIVEIALSLHSDFCLYIVTNIGNLYFASVDIKNSRITNLQKYFLGTYETAGQTGQEIVVPRRPSCICANEYNILIGYEHLEEFTLVKICAISTQPPCFEPIKFSCPFLHKIVRMNFAAETMAVCITVQVKENDKHDFSIPIESQFLKEKGEGKIIKQNVSNHKLNPGKVFPIVFNLLLYDTLVETLRSPIQKILNSMLLTKKILDISIIPTKKLVLVLSADKKIKAIKYDQVSSISFEKMLAWEICFNQNDNPTTLDVHPLTFNVAVGFKEGLKIFNTFWDGMKTTNIHFPMKNCECVRYSKFGHLLVAGSSNQVMLINPYQNNIKHTFNLSYSYNTKEINFIDRDMYLSGFFGNGCAQVMTMEGNKIFEVANKNSKCVHACYDPVFDIMVMSFEDNEVKFYREHGEMEFAIMWTYPFIVTKIMIVNELGTAFMGTSTGKIRAYQWPFTDMTKFNRSFTEMQLHRAPITQIKIVHDFSYLITGAEDGTVFISKITAFSDGMVVNDSSILHTFKVKKNYSSLYYLQNLLCTNSSLESEKEQEIVQYESDKADFQSEYSYILQSLHTQIDVKLKQEEKDRKESLRAAIEPLECLMDEVNHKTVEVKDELQRFIHSKTTEVDAMDLKRTEKMRELYKQSDHLKTKLQFYQKQYAEDEEQTRHQLERQHQNYIREMKAIEDNLIDDCSEMEKEFYDSLTNYSELMKEEEEEGDIYKHKMMEQLDNELLEAHQHGEGLRKIFNKSTHDIRTTEEKYKYFQQLKSEMTLDIENANIKKEHLLRQIDQLIDMLKQKDQQIFYEEKAVKELLKKSINNYSHEEYLKHKQDELINKAKYLEKQIEDLDKKYKVFQNNFVEASKQTNEFIVKIEESYKTIEMLKDRKKAKKETSYLRNYHDQEIITKVQECYHACHSRTVFTQKIKEILNSRQVLEDGDTGEKIDAKIEKRDHLIDQVVNTNKLRKIEDTIKKTIMIKLNRETVNLTSEVNELRKEKKTLATKTNELIAYIKQIKMQLPDKENQKQLSSLTDIVPINISVIRSHNSKYSRPLPFQVYQQNKCTNRNSTSYSKLNAKSIGEESSTQLPSINKNQSYSGSVLEQSSLFGVQEYEDEVAQ